MSTGYKAVQWGRQKYIYDGALAAILALVIGCYIALNIALRPNSTAETLVIRSTSLAAFLLLHVILCIGPLARLDAKFLPLLYNRRHLGVVMFALALVHAVLAIFQFHAVGNINPLVSVFTSYRQDYNPYVRQSGNIADFPFEPFGALALVILFLMAATSHDFWLKNLGASFWKTLHLFVYIAYGALVIHVGYGILQSEQQPLYVLLVAAGFVTVFTLHLLAWRKEARVDAAHPAPERDGYVPVCRVDDLREGSGKALSMGKERVAVFLHNDRVFALSNTCRHQGGPIGEGRILDGCITCPWHGWQYRPEDGCSPPPFHEVVPTYEVRVEKGIVYVLPQAQQLESVRAGAACAGAVCAGAAAEAAS